MIFRRLAHTVFAAATSAAILLTGLVSANAATPPPATPPGAKCARATYIRPSDGAIVTRTVCVCVVAQSSGGVR